MWRACSVRDGVSCCVAVAGAAMAVSFACVNDPGSRCSVLVVSRLRASPDVVWRVGKGCR